MVYLVTTQEELFENELYTIISADKALEMMQSWDVIQIDSETNGRDSHLCDFLCFQFGNKKADTQIVVDHSCVDIKLYKNLLESKFLIGQNLKFDLQFLYKHGIVPRNVYDTMIVEQLLYLGYPVAGKPGGISYALNAIAQRRLNIDIDKTVRGEIIWRGLDSSVIQYAAGDVMYLEDIRDSQLIDLKKKDCEKAAELENRFVPVIAYLEWCGIKLDQEKWKEKMKQDQKNLNQSLEALNQFTIKHPNLKQFTYVDLQGDLFSGFNTEPVCTVNWSSSQQVIKIAKILGFNTKTKDKKTGESKDSVLEKALSVQKGINDEFLKLYFAYQEYAKVVSSFGQGHLDAVNPLTGRIHSTFKQLGAASGRMSCGSTQPNTDLEKYKKLPKGSCKYPNLQQLPSDDVTRSCFVAPEGHLMVSADFNALESRLGADIYQEKEMLKEFLEGSGDMHSLCAKMVFAEELKDVEVKDIKKVRPDLRKKVKSVEFAKQFGGSAFAIAGSLGCSMEEAQKFSDYYDQGFSGVTNYKKKGSRFVRENGYVLMCEHTGHKMYWYDHEEWKQRQAKYQSSDWSWDNYRQKHKGTDDWVEQQVKMHFKAAAKWDRMALNGPTQGSGACIIKESACMLFDWIMDNNFFEKVNLCALVHDEIVCDYPEELQEFPQILEKLMQQAAAKYCKSLPIPAEAAVGDHWIH
jgi:DNA polymerase I-like protein with 3'-5' exonuclease and polymerase domains